MVDQPPAQLDNLLILSAAAVPFAKTIVDVITTNWPTRPTWFPILAVGILGPAVVALLEAYLAVPFTGSIIAGCVLGGWSAGGAAIGQTVLSAKAIEARKDATASDPAPTHF